MDSGKISNLQAQLDDDKRKNEEVINRYDEVERDIADLEEKIDVADERFSTASTRVKELESHAVEVQNSLRSMTINDDAASAKNTHLSDKIKMHEEDLKNTKQRADDAEIKMHEEDLKNTKQRA